MKAFANIAALAVLIIASPPSSSEDTPQAMAEKAALSWLGLVDAGDYAQSWVTAADYFQNSIEQWQWVSKVSQVRAPLRAVKSRTVSSVTFARSLPGVPDGEYFVIQFATAFRKKAPATETVTVMKNPDGRWCVGGYYIR
jgi:hypothetical protein